MSGSARLWNSRCGSPPALFDQQSDWAEQPFGGFDDAVPVGGGGDVRGDGQYLAAVLAQGAGDGVKLRLTACHQGDPGSALGKRRGDVWADPA